MIGFFQWLRDSVRRTVLLGFSDAVEQLGAPADGKEMNPHLLAVLAPADRRWPSNISRRSLAAGSSAAAQASRPFAGAIPRAGCQARQLMAASLRAGNRLPSVFAAVISSPDRRSSWSRVGNWLRTRCVGCASSSWTASAVHCPTFLVNARRATRVLRASLAMRVHRPASLAQHVGLV